MGLLSEDEIASRTRMIGPWDYDPEDKMLVRETTFKDFKEAVEFINKLAEEGTAIILISSELPEILSLSHRIIVMREGKITKILNNKEATQEKIMSYAIN